MERMIVVVEQFWVSLHLLFLLLLITSIFQVVTSVRERVCGSSEEQPSPWLWQHQQGTTASRLSSFFLFFQSSLFLCELISHSNQFVEYQGKKNDENSGTVLTLLLLDLLYSPLQG